MKRTFSSAAKVSGYVLDWFSSPARLRGQAALPTTLSLLATDNCNSKCVMCDIWKNKSENELSAEEFGKVLKDPLFREVRHIGISGGEPTLRKDLAEMVGEILGSLPKARSLSVTSHGFHTKRWKEALPAIREHCERHEVALRINISIDGVGEVHNKIRGNRTAFKTATETIDAVSEAGVDVQVQTTLTAPNAFGATRTLEWARKRKLDIVFRQGTLITRLYNKDSMNDVELPEDARSFLADFIESKRLDEVTTSPARRLFYKELAKRLVTGAPRKAPCIFQGEGIVLSAHGDMFHCSISEESIGNALTESAHDQYFATKSVAIRANLLRNICPGCVHDQSGIWNPAVLIGHSIGRMKAMRRLIWVKQAVPVVAGLLRKLMRARMASGGSSAAKDQKIRRVVIIGAYGGEHVGDAAILGGVLRRLHERHGVEEAVVASIRAHRTTRWVKTIQSPVQIEVCSYEDSRVRKRIDEADAIVLAGGPLMDLPKLLNQHLGAVLYAKSIGKSFLVEGIGVGPFKNPLTRATGRALLELADQIVVRSEGDWKSPSLKGLQASYDKDPAFDYLETRDGELRLTFEEATSLNQLLKETDDRKVLGVNLRPLWAKYAGKGYDMEQVTEHFLDQLADGIKALNASLGGKLVVVSFPMNPDQYGFSDLESAQMLEERLGGEVEHRIWDAEPGIDAVLALLRRLDAVLAMRFHACIFSLSQGIPTFGIDYSLGPQGKVGKLLSEAGHQDRLAKMESMTSEWVDKKIAQVLTPTL
jgi:molybdenum cofactor biosynthesis enzyme MoaA/polysaccharide pyruvyl transferase WcaK-like protein